MKTCFCQVIQGSRELTGDPCQSVLSAYKGAGMLLPEKGVYAIFLFTQHILTCLVCFMSISHETLASFKIQPRFLQFPRDLTRGEGTSRPRVSPELPPTASSQVSLPPFQSHTSRSGFFRVPLSWFNLQWLLTALEATFKMALGN